MNPIVHFEIHAADQDRAQKFYETVFGWRVKDLGPQMGNYRLIMTGSNPDVGPAKEGVNGGMNPRKGETPAEGAPVNAYICTIGVDNLDAYLEKAKTAGGTMALEKMGVPGVGWLAYMKDTEGNLFGMLQTDPNAK
jgi:predicted enzyme related to lactoylglutathione lyase